MTIRIPCDDACICVPICRNKSCSAMINDCSLLHNHLSKLEKTVPVNEYRTIFIRCMKRLYSITNHKYGATWTAYTKDGPDWIDNKKQEVGDLEDEY